MTKQQQNALKLWKQDTNQPLPASLENVLIEDCFEELKNSEEVQEKFNEYVWFSRVLYEKDGWASDYGFYDNHSFEEMLSVDKSRIIQTLLSQAVMPFLNTNVPVSERYIYKDEIDEYRYFTLDHFLYREFTEALRTGKTFDEAYKIINLIYLQNV